MDTDSTKIEKLDMLTPDTARVVAKLVTERRGRKIAILYEREENFDKEGRYFASILKFQFGITKGKYRRTTKKRMHVFAFNNGNKVVLTSKKMITDGRFQTYMRYNVDGSH